MFAVVLFMLAADAEPVSARIERAAAAAALDLDVARVAGTSALVTGAGLIWWGTSQ